MIATIIFILAGVGLVTLVLAKRHELINKRRVFILDVVSKVDEHTRRASQLILHFYAEGKHKFVFVATKQLPTKVKIHLNRAIDYAKERGEERFGTTFGNLRDSRDIEKPENISEFFKSISQVERGVGELHDDPPVAKNTSNVVVEELVEEVIMDPRPQVTEEVETPIIEVKKPTKARAPRHQKAKVEPIKTPEPITTKTPRKRAPKRRDVETIEVL